MKIYTDNSTLEEYFNAKNLDERILRARTADIFNCLAAYETMQAESGAEDRTVRFDAANQYYTKSGDIDLVNTHTWTGRAFLNLFKTPNDLDAIFFCFNNATQTDSKEAPSNVLAYMGKGLILLHMHKYTEALQMYKKALELNPDLPSYCRLGLAIAHYALHNNGKAKQAFERVLQMDEGKNVHALLGLYLLQFQEFQSLLLKFQQSAQNVSHGDNAILEQAKQQLLQAHDMLVRAEKLDGQSPLVRYHLSNFYFFQGQYSKSRDLADQALRKINDKHELEAQNNSAPGAKGKLSAIQTHQHFKAALNYNIARSYHMENNYDHALEYYQRGKELDESNLLILFGYAQMCLKNSEHDKALKSLLHLSSHHPSNYDVQRLLGITYNLMHNYTAAYSCLKKAVEKNSNDVELLIEFAETAQMNQAYQDSYLAYTRARRLLTEVHKITAPFELLNNLAVVALKMGKLEEAQQLWDHILNSDASNGNSNGAERFAPHLLTVHYNLAFLYEAQSKYDDAQKKLKEIIQHYPDYIDAHLRLGSIYQLAGNHKEAKEKYEEARSKQAESAVAASLLGNWHMDRGEMEAAKPFFEQILQFNSSSLSSTEREQYKRDAYAKIALGNIQVQKIHAKARKEMLAAQAHGNNPNDKKRIVNLNYRDAAQYYDSVLQKDDSEWYAAQGLGCVLAEQGKFTEAKEIFSSIKDNLAHTPSASDCADVWCNLGHVYGQLGMHVSAIKMYQHCLAHFSHSSTFDRFQLLLYLGRAYFYADQMQDCKKTLLRALQLNPSHQGTWYNLGLALEDYAINILQKDPNERSYNEVESASHELQHAFEIFEKLAQQNNADRNLGDIQTKSKSHAAWCSSNIQKGLVHLDFTRKKEAERAALLEKSLAKEAALQASIQMKREMEEKARVDELVKLEEIARLNEQKVQETITSEQWRAPVEEVKSTGRTRVKRERGEEGEGVEDEIAARRRQKKEDRKEKKRLEEAERARNAQGADEDEREMDEAERKRRKKDAKRAVKERKKAEKRAKRKKKGETDAEYDERMAAKKARKAAKKAAKAAAAEGGEVQAEGAMEGVEGAVEGAVAAEGAEQHEDSESSSSDEEGEGEGEGEEKEEGEGEQMEGEPEGEAAVEEEYVAPVADDDEQLPQAGRDKDRKRKKRRIDDDEEDEEMEAGQEQEAGDAEQTNTADEAPVDTSA